MANTPILSALGGRCPMCGEGRAFTGVLTMADVCDHCGARFDRDPGFFTGATTIPYILASVWVTGLLAVLGMMGLLRDPRLTWWVIGSTMVFVLIVFPFSKRLWLGMYGAWGYLYADPPPRDDAA